MAIFNESVTSSFINEAAEWHGKYFLSKEELHDPKFRSSQFKKVNAIIRNCLKSEFLSA